MTGDCIRCQNRVEEEHWEAYCSITGRSCEEQKDKCPFEDLFGETFDPVGKIKNEFQEGGL